MQAKPSGPVPGLPPLTLLVVDDDRSVREACQAIAESLGMKALSAASAHEGLARIEQASVDVVLTDLRMPGMDGIQFLEAIRRLQPDVFVIIMSGYGSIETAVESMRKGATAFISKPFRLDELRQTLHRIAGDIASRHGEASLHQEKETFNCETLLTGRSPEMRQLYRAIKHAAGAATPILILGEAGTGKEDLARAIHLAIRGASVPFIPVDCCSLSPELLEGELFGHAKGSFPAAVTDKDGLLVAAGEGTVLLNSIGDLPIDTQAKLARTIQTRTVRPYGATESVPLKARIMATSQRDLAQLVAKGVFRQDLYFLLSVLALRLPPLRQRAADIPLIAEHFLNKFQKEHQAFKALASDALAALSQYHWPGNLWEMRSVLQRAYLLAPGNTIGVAQLPPEVASSTQTPAPAEERHGMSLADLEREGVVNALRETRGDKQKAARLLGVSRTTLYRKLHEYDIAH
ncbi:MAG: sigma-54 dependent transcriptional regulator [Acidobacteriota bacterium]|nr:sigma-54 dependent transcriptional regulator [Acidobacteriota bacterium]